ncbi:Organic cation/carnitine transporter 3 [Nymphaea thermarum]|nr:Organic cation/carnitine transporter 3 [Nymphaea thermarum]
MAPPSHAPLPADLLPVSEPLLPKEDPSSLDDVIEQHIGGFGLAQMFQAFLVSCAWIFDAQYTFINIFTDAEPKWHCSPDSAAAGTCSPSSSICSMDSSLWSWDRPAHASIVSQWNLTCSVNPVLAGLPPSAFFMGCLVGGLVLATLADSTLGRHKMLFLSTFTMGLSGILTAASPNIWFYSVARFVGGVARATVGTSALVLSTEFVGKRWRGEVGIFGFVCFTFGFLSLPVSAYLLRTETWRLIYLVVSVPTLLYSLLVRFLVFESPRWLIVKGKESEAVDTLRRIARRNGMADDFSLTTGLCHLAGEKDGAGSSNIYSALMILWQKPWAFRRLTAVMIAGFGIGLVYYGMPLAVGDLDFNLYLSVTFNALSELPSALLTFFLISKMNRRTGVVAFTMASGVLSVACVLMGKGVQMIAEVVSFFCACTAFTVIMIYCLELFPTSVRNSAVAMLRQALVLGGVFSPMLVVAGRKESIVCFGAFGVVIIVCGLSVVCLPETKGCTFCDTMEEQECRDVLGQESPLSLNSSCSSMFRQQARPLVLGNRAANMLGGHHQPEHGKDVVQVAAA